MAALLLVSWTAGCATKSAPIPRFERPPLQEMGAASEPEAPPIYRIDYGDRLEVKFLYHPELDTEPLVRPDGQLTISGLGDFYAVGLTPDELETDVVRRASITHRNPIVSILVRDYTAHRVYVGGKVRQPGYVSLRPGMTTLRAILERGGFTDSAQLDSVLHVAWNPAGGYSAQRLNMEEVLETGATEQDISLGPNDIVFVPATWVSDAGVFVDQYIRDMIPIREPTTRFPTFGTSE